MFNWLITKGIVPYVVISLIATTIIGFAGWGITKVRLNHKTTQLELQIQKNENDRKTYENAAIQAKAKAEEVARKKEQEYADIKAEQDAAYSKLLNDYRITLVRYKNSVRSGGPSVASPTGSTSSAEGEGGDSFIPVPEDDLRICAVNTAKAQIAHDWVMSLEQK